MSGCGYPTVSPKTYEIAKALYSACNRQSDAHVELVSETIQAAKDGGEITSREASWLETIVDQARQGEWEAAMLECRKLMEDQIGREGSTSPHSHGGADVSQAALTYAVLRTG